MSPRYVNMVHRFSHTISLTNRYKTVIPTPSNNHSSTKPSRPKTPVKPTQHQDYSSKLATPHPPIGSALDYIQDPRALPNSDTTATAESHPSSSTQQFVANTQLGGGRPLWEEFLREQPHLARRETMPAGSSTPEPSVRHQDSYTPYCHRRLII